VKQPIRLPELDGLRGLASLMVFFNHLALTILPSLSTLSPDASHHHIFITIGFSPLNIFWGGDFGVCIFFILSGYVLAQFCSHTRLGLLAMMVRRYLRLALPMLFSTLFAFALLDFGMFFNGSASKIITHSDWLALWYHMQPTVWIAIKEGLVSAFVHGKSAYNSNLWTMRIELIGSMMLFIYYVLPNRFTRIILLTPAILFLPSYFPLFPAGALLFELSYSMEDFYARNSKYIEIVAIILFLMGIYAGSFPASGTNVSFASPWHNFLIKSRNAQAWHMWGSVFMLLGVIYSKTINYYFKSMLFQFLGKISFSLYLVQIMIFCSFTSFMMLYFKDLDYLLAVLIVGISSLCISLILSYIIAIYVDATSIKFSRRLGKLVDQFERAVSGLLSSTFLDLAHRYNDK